MNPFLGKLSANVVKATEQFIWFRALLLIWLFVAPPVAYAYIDPGSGSYVFQLLLAGLFGLLFSIKTLWGYIITLLRRRNESSHQDTTASASDEQ